MNCTMKRTMKRFPIMFAVAAMLGAVLAQAAEPARPGDLGRRYQQERAVCQGVEDRAACIREAGAALQEARGGKLADANTSFESNRVARCGYLKGDDKEYCLRRMNGEGTTSGSVAGGGILRELTVTVPAKE